MPPQEPPISYADLRDFFEWTNVRPSRFSCDHSYRDARAYLERHGLPAEPMIEWLGRNGAGCDCEVICNVAGANGWDERVGWDPPDEDEA